MSVTNAPVGNTPLPLSPNRTEWVLISNFDVLPLLLNNSIEFFDIETTEPCIIRSDTVLANISVLDKIAANSARVAVCLGLKVLLGKPEMTLQFTAALM
jgi:hypothetical protein